MFVQAKPASLILRTLLALFVLLLLSAMPKAALPPAADATLPDTYRRVAHAAALPALYSLDEVEELLSGNLYQRERSLNIRYAGDTQRLQELLPQVMEGLLQKDDYLRYCLKSWRWRWFGAPGELRLHFFFDYISTKDEEAYVRQEVARILGRITAPGMNEHEKVRVIHDYVVATVAYDNTYANHSAYSALSKGKAVCRGYALLLHKMLHAAGVEARIISGLANGEKHAWNMVRLDGNWYHLDATWNSPFPDVPGRVLYAYYNLSDAAMQSTHKWEQRNYPSAVSPYRPPAGMELNDTIITAYAGEKLPSRFNEAADKIWTIRFNQRVNANTINNGNIFVADRQANLHPIRAHTGDDGSSAHIVPLGNFPAGETLYLLISREVASQGGGAMEGPAWMEFTVR